MSKFAILEGHKVVRCDVETWGEWFENICKGDDPMAGRRVGATHIDDTCVSTVFIGLDHQYEPLGSALWFETMIMRGPLDGEMRRYTRWNEAEAGHKRMVARVRSAQGVSPN